MIRFLGGILFPKPLKIYKVSLFRKTFLVSGLQMQSLRFLIEFHSNSKTQQDVKVETSAVEIKVTSKIFLESKLL